MTVQIRIAQNSDATEWDFLNSRSRFGTLFHEWNFLKIVEKHTDTRLFPIIGLKNGVSIGLFPLFFQKKGPVRMVFSPPPHAALFYIGPVLTECDSLRQEQLEKNYIEFHDAVENFIKDDLGAEYIHISLSPALQDSRPFKWAGYRIYPNFDYSVDLSVGIDALYSSFDHKQRSDLKRAKERGMEFEIGSRREYEKIIDLMNIRYAQQGKIVTTSNSYFIDLFDKYEKNIIVSTIKVEDETVTGTIHLQYRDTVFNWQGNPKPKNPITPSPNDLLIWESIRNATNCGFKKYTTMSAAGNKRLHTYYAAKCNPELVVRYVATKKSNLSKFFEKGYTHILKPLRGKTQYSR
jgi:hypothetical protein